MQSRQLGAGRRTAAPGAARVTGLRPRLRRTRVAQVDAPESSPVVPPAAGQQQLEPAPPASSNGTPPPPAPARPPTPSAAPQQQRRRAAGWPSSPRDRAASPTPGWLLSQPATDGSRPFLPQVDLPKLLDTLLGDPDKALRDNTLLGSTLVTDGGPVRLFSPVVAKPPGSPVAESLPLMFYLPGIDGTGLAAYRQFPRLTSAFDLRCLIVPRSDRSSFEQLIDSVAALIRAELDASSGGRPVYLMGESFGAVLGLALAHKLGSYVDRVVAVNPASGFDSSVWPTVGPLLAQLPPDVYKLLPFALAPVMANPLAMAMHDVDSSAPLPQQASDLLYGLVDLAPQLAALRLVLPPETLSWRLQLLKQGGAWLGPRLGDIKQRVLLLAGERDLLIPSKAEAERLAKALPRGRMVALPAASHAALQEAGVDLANILKAEGFYVPERRLSNSRPSVSPTDGGGAAFGTTAPIQLPTARELELDTQGFVGVINRLTSPVFYSTQPDGSVVRGLGGVPAHDRPVLLIGNHQLFAGDMYPMIQTFVEELGVLPRGLAHPVVFAGPDALAEAGRRGGMTREGGGGGAAVGGAGGNGDGASPAQFSSLLSTYGAVPVSGKNMHKLLAAGEMVLLYPGGAREAFKRRGEAYKIIWPDKAEFVRMAAKFGATIVPFAAIGADEAITTHLTGDEVEQLRKLLPQLPPLPQLPWQAQAQAQQPAESDAARRARIPPARVGVNATMEDVEAFISPGFFTFNAPRRTYFIFRQPIATSPALASDRAACQALYGTIRAEVEGGLGYLLRMREADPYKDFLPRVAYEASWGWTRRAPSFEP